MSKQCTWKKALCHVVAGSLLLTLCPPLIQAEAAPGSQAVTATELAKVATDIPAFPGAEGGGKYVTGGRGGEVYEVTTLEDYGRGEQAIPGSLRAAAAAEASANKEQAAAAREVNNIVVATNGPANFTSLQAAIDAVPDNSSTRTVIRLKKGTYREKIKVNSSKKNLSIIGEDREKTIIAFNDTAKTVVDGKELGTSNSYTMRVQSPDFILENVTVANTEGTGQVQAVALYAEGDRGQYRNVKITGLQDTLLVNRGRQYFKDSYISGSVDFIFGNSPAVFENSIIHSLRAGYVTAASTEENKPGLVFIQCRLTAENGLKGKVELGRPWRPYAHVAYIKSYMDNHIKPGGWNNWGKASNEKTARFVEFDNNGPGAATAGRVLWAKQLTVKEANQYTVKAVLGGTDHWNPQ